LIACPLCSLRLGLRPTTVLLQCTTHKITDLDRMSHLRQSRRFWLATRVARQKSQVWQGVLHVASWRVTRDSSSEVWLAWPRQSTYARQI